MKNNQFYSNTATIYESKQNKVCVCVCVSLGRITYCILHCSTLTRTLSSVFPPRRSLSFPFGPVGDGVHYHTAFKLCQWSYTPKTASVYDTKPATATNRFHKCTQIGCFLRFLPYNFLHRWVFHVQSNSETVGNYSVKWYLNAFKLINCVVP